MTSTSSKGARVAAAALANLKDSRKEKLRESISDIKEEIIGQTDTMKSVKKNLEDLESSLTDLSKSLSSIKTKTINERESEFLDVLNKLKKNFPIDSFRVTKNNEIVIRTKMLSVLCPDWHKAKDIGKFDIVINLPISYPDDIRIFNITKKMGKYDSPTINDGSPCWGNIFQDIKQDIVNLDIYELVSDIVAYITSPNVEDGYIDGEWDTFLDDAKKVKAGYCFESRIKDDTLCFPYSWGQLSTATTNFSPRGTWGIHLSGLNESVSNSPSVSISPSEMLSPDELTFQRSLQKIVRFMHSFNYYCELNGIDALFDYLLEIFRQLEGVIGATDLIILQFRVSDMNTITITLDLGEFTQEVTLRIFNSDRMRI